jgi:hypothetical protein
MAAAQDRTPYFRQFVHSYFPEWADRPDSSGLLLEADHNSYLAGGYAEVFGYHIYSGAVPAFPALSSAPEASSLWGVQIGGLHPGYPECARPQDRSNGHPKAITGPSRPGSPKQLHTRRSQDPPREATGHYEIIRVGQRHNGRRVPLQLTLFTRRWRVYVRKRRHLMLG